MARYFLKPYQAKLEREYQYYRCSSHKQGRQRGCGSSGGYVLGQSCKERMTVSVTAGILDLSRQSSASMHWGLGEKVMIRVAIVSTNGSRKIAQAFGNYTHR